MRAGCEACVRKPSPRDVSPCGEGGARRTLRGEGLTGAEWDVRRVLVLEDDEDLRFILCELLAASGADECVSAGSVDELRRKREAVLRCGLALLDINLGAGVPSGLDAYRWLRDNGFAGRTVFLTGHARSHPLVREALALEQVRVLSKPIESNILLSLVKDGMHENGAA